MNNFINSKPCRKHPHARPVCGWHRPVHDRRYSYDERNIVTRTYDAAGNVIAVLDAEGHVPR